MLAKIVILLRLVSFLLRRGDWYNDGYGGRIKRRLRKVRRKGWRFLFSWGNWGVGRGGWGHGSVVVSLFFFFFFSSLSGG